MGKKLATLQHPLKIKQEAASRDAPSASALSATLPGAPLFPGASRKQGGAAEGLWGRGRPRDGAGTRTWTLGTPALRPSHLQPPPPRPGSPAEVPQEAPPERGWARGPGRGGGAGPARCLTHG